MRVHCRLLVLLAIASLGGVRAFAASSSDFCALSVKISGWDGSPINFTLIELIDASGHVELRRFVGTEFQICDFGFGRHTLRLGVNECFPLAVSNLEVRLGHPITLDVRLPKCVFGHTMYGSSTGEPVCFSYFRTTTGDGKPLSQVQVEEVSRSKPGTRAFLTESYGRWQGTVAGTKEFKISKPGYSPEMLRVSCSDGSPLEVAIALSRQQ